MGNSVRTVVENGCVAPTAPLSVRARAALVTAWRRMTGEEPADLRRDLAALGDIFDARLDAGQLLRRLERVEPSEEPPQELASMQPPLMLRIGARTVVTPEGRLALDPSAAAALYSLPQSTMWLLDTYREGCQARIAELAADVGGRGEMTMPLALGVLVTLLGCGALGEEQALVITKSNRDSLRVTLRPVLAVFNETFAVARNRGTEPDFDGYPLSKARRRMGGDLRREPERRLPSRLFLESTARTRTMEVLAHELVVRRGVSAEAAGAVVSGSLDALTTARSELAGLGVRVGDLEGLHAALVSRFSAAGS